MCELIINSAFYLFFALFLIPLFGKHLLKAVISKRKGMNTSGAGVSNGFVFNPKTKKFEDDQDKGTN